MSLRDVAYLEIDLVDSTDTTHTGVFRLQEDLNETGETAISYLLSNRGQLLRKAYDIGTDVLPEEVAEADLEQRKGYHVDGGTGEYRQNLTWKASQGDEWGDGSTDPGDPSDISKYDATGSDAQAMKHVFEWYVTQATHGSTGNARLHIGEWCDDTHATSAGAFGAPMTVAIEEATVTKDPDDPSAIEVTLQMTWTSVFPGVVGETIDNVVDFIKDF